MMGLREKAGRWVAGLVMAVAAAGCGGGTDPADNEAAPAEAAEAAEAAETAETGNEPGGFNLQVGGEDGPVSLQINTPEGGMSFSAGDKAEIPKDFPSDVPVYEGLRLQAAGKMGGGFTVSGVSADSVDAVATFYKDTLTGDGWSEEMSMDQGGDSPVRLRTYKKGGRIVNLAIATGDEGTQVTITTAAE